MATTGLIDIIAIEGFEGLRDILPHGRNFTLIRLGLATFVFSYLVYIFYIKKQKSRRSMVCIDAIFAFIHILAIGNQLAQDFLM